MINHINNRLNHHRERTQRRIRAQKKRTRLYIDHEYISAGFCKRFKPTVSLVYLVLAKYANYTTQSCYPSLDTLQRETGITNRNTLLSAVETLEAHRLIVIDHSPGRRSNTYTLLDPACWEKGDSIKESA